MRWTRAMRCSSTAGFHGTSRLMTVSAACRFSPVPPASVLRNTRHVRVVAEALQQRPRGPCRARRRAARRSRRRAASSTSAALRSITSHWLNTTTLCAALRRQFAAPAPRTRPASARRSSACRTGTCCRTASAGWRGSARMRLRSSSVRYFFCSSRAERRLLLLVRAALLVGHLDEDGVVGARRQLRQHLAAGPAQEDRRQLLADRVEVAVAEQVARRRRGRGGRAGTGTPGRAGGRPRTARCCTALRACSPAACRSAPRRSGCWSFLTARDVFDSQFLMRWASSSTIRSGCQALSASQVAQRPVRS